MNLPALSGGLQWKSFGAQPFDYTTGQIVIQGGSSASWTVNGDSNYGSAANWSPQQIPNGSGQVATFGNGDGLSPATTVTNSTVAVAIDGAYAVGALIFDNTNGTSYTLATDGNSSHGFTLTSGAGTGSSITVTAGNQVISTNLTLADAGGNSFVLSSGTSLLVSGTIGQSSPGKSISLSGGGTLTLGSTNSFSGDTTVTSGTLRTTANNGLGTAGTGALTINAANNVTSAVNLGGDQTISSLSGTVGTSNSVASVSVAAGKTLTDNQATGTPSFAGSVALGAGATLIKSAGGTQELTGNTSLGAGSNVQITGGTLKLNLASGNSPVVSTGVTATVASGATLELAGPVSALTDATTNLHRVDITNNAGTVLADSGAVQQVGGIDGTGNVQVNSAASLTANHITATSLVIGGDANHAAVVTIAASNADGTPMATSGFAVADALTAGASFGSGALSSSSLLAADGGSSSPAVSLDGGNLGGGSLSGTGAVPEPSSLLLMGIGLLGGLFCVSAGSKREEVGTVAEIPANARRSGSASCARGIAQLGVNAAARLCRGASSPPLARV